MPLCTQLTGSTTRSAALLASTLAATLLLNLTTTVPVARAGKPAPPPRAVALPPTRYTIQWLEGGPGWDALFPRDINHRGDLAGPAYNSTTGDPAAFAFDFSIGQAFNLNSLGAPWWDLNAAVPTLGTGWRATSAYGINDRGDISGIATNNNPNLPTRAFVLVNALSRDDDDRAREFLLLPSVGTASQSGRCINNNGQVIGSSDFSLIRFLPTGTGWPYYAARTTAIQPGIRTDFIMDLNDDGVVVARDTTGSSTVSYRQLIPGALPEVFNGLEFWCISNGANPWISGLKAASGKGKSAVPGGPIRLPALGGANQVQRLASYGVYARAVNDEGDAVFESAGRGYLYSDAINRETGMRYGSPIVVNGVVVDYDGVLPLDQMVVNPDDEMPEKNPDWLDGIRLDGINNCDPVSGLGLICGYAPAGRPSRGFLLTPVPAP